MTSILWLRRDLRRSDHPALAAAHADGGEVLPLFVLDPGHLAQLGSVRAAALPEVLRATQEVYEGQLVIREGDPADVVREIAATVGATRVHISRETEPWGAERDARVREVLAEDGIELVETGTPYVHGPGTLRTGGGTAYRVYSPFARAWRAAEHPAPCVEPAGLRLTRGGLDDVALPQLDPPVPLPSLGEQAAQERWASFRTHGLEDYEDSRNRPDEAGTSQLSIHLTWGAIHPRTLLADLRREHGDDLEELPDGPRRFLAEIVWREFYADVLHHQPHSARHDLSDALAGMRYDDLDEETFAAWREGRTGYPFVDAGMRQLLATGWLHNRVRMVVASFLTKDLHCWWPLGAGWFLERLLDGDLASNQHGWQWTAGTGTDPSPYFRIFNPVTQGERFDPRGDYVRRWIPELAHLPGRAVHQPWRYDDGHAHGYPQPLVDHAEERLDALARYEQAR